MKNDSKQLLKNEYFWLMLILLLGFALRVYGLGDVGLNNDEGIVYDRWISKSFKEIMVDDLVLNNHTFAQILAHTSIIILSDKLFALRWPSLCISVLGMALIYRVARGLFNRQVGLISALLLAISPFAIFFAHSFRGYGGVIVLPVLVYTLGLLALQTGRWRYWLALGVVSALMVYTHLFTILAYFNFLLFVGLIVLFGNRWRVFKRPSLLSLGTSIATTVMMLGVLYSPIWLKALQALISPGEETEGLLWVVRPSVPASVWYNLWLFNGFWQKGSLGGHGVFVLIAVIIIGLGLGFTRAFRFQLLAVLGWAFLPFVEIWLAQQVLTDFWARPVYLGYTLPAFLILAGYGLVELSRYKLFKSAPRALNMALLPLILLAVLWYSALDEYYRVFANARWQAIGNFLQQNSRPDDLIICHRYNHPWRDVDIDSEDLCTRTLNYRQAADSEAITDVLTSHELVYNTLPNANTGIVNRKGRVWTVVWQIPDSAKLPPAETDNLTAAEFNRFGRAVVLLTGQAETYVGNLTKALLELRSTVDSPDQEYSYSLLVAPLAAASGQPEIAQVSLETAQRNAPNHPEAPTKLERTTSLVQTLSPLAIEHPLQENFGGEITLHGYLFWQAEKPIQQDYSVFLHVRDQTGQTVTQLDYQPFDGRYPTKIWQPGQMLIDTRQIVIPPDFIPGEYELFIGFYDPDTMERLPLLDDLSGENTFHLTSLVVDPAKP